jgi:hypothetical protein
MSAQLTTFDDVCLRCIARHEDVRLQAGPSCVGGKRSAGVAGAGNGELGCSEMFCHGHGNAHPARFETLRRVYRFVLYPEINVVTKFFCAQ